MSIFVLSSWLREILDWLACMLDMLLQIMGLT